MDEVFPEPPDDAPFWQRLKWHMQRGTRPPGENSHRGRWTNTKLGAEFSLTGQAVGRWISPRDDLRTIPSAPNTLEQCFFGDKPERDDAWYGSQRRKFRSAVARAQAEADRKKITKAQATRKERGSVEAPMAPLSASSQPVANIPIRPPLHFLGRKRDLLRMWDKLEGESRSSFAPPTVVLHGIRGVGKTSLAVTYANAHLGRYRVRWWLNASSTDLLCDGLRSLGVALGWITDGGAKDEEDGRAAAYTVLSHLNIQGDGMLLIYDNAPDANLVRPFLPTGGAARSIITSNAHVWGSLAAPIEIAVWSKEVGADYLLRRTARPAGERTDGERLAQALEGLPLALEQAAAYCEVLEVSFSTYLERFESAPLRMLDRAQFAPPDYYGGRTVARTVQLALEALKEQNSPDVHPAAARLLLSCALLGAYPVPLFLFIEGRLALGASLANLLEGDGLDQAVATLRAFALVYRENVPDEHDAAIETASIRLHRLVREIAVSEIGDEDRHNLVGSLLDALAAAFPLDAVRNIEQWPRARRLASIILDFIDFEVIREHPLKMSRLLPLLSGFMDSFRFNPYQEHHLFAYLDRDDIPNQHQSISNEGTNPETAHAAKFESILELREKANERLVAANLPVDEVSSAPLIDFYIADALYDNGFAREAEKKYNVSTLNYLKIMRHEAFDTDGGSQWDRSLTSSLIAYRDAMIRRFRSRFYPASPTSLRVIALLFESAGRPAEARACFEEALCHAETSLDPDSPALAVILTDFGRFCATRQDTGHDESLAARLLLERALQIFDGDRDGASFSATTCRETLGDVLTRMADAGRAKQLYNQALNWFAYHERHAACARVRAKIAGLQAQ